MNREQQTEQLTRYMADFVSYISVSYTHLAGEGRRASRKAWGHKSAQSAGDLKRRRNQISGQACPG